MGGGFNTFGKISVLIIELAWEKLFIFCNIP
jgi:hypothetical protein